MDRIISHGLSVRLMCSMAFAVLLTWKPVNWFLWCKLEISDEDILFWF